MAMARRVCLFLFIFQLFGGNGPGAELLKLPFLVRHFHLHQRANPEATWWEYLRLHYANSKHRNADPAHRQLPLHAGSAHAETVMALPVDLVAILTKSEPGKGSALHCYDERLLPLDYRARLLRPPRA